MLVFESEKRARRRSFRAWRAFVAAWLGASAPVLYALYAEIYPNCASGVNPEVDDQTATTFAGLARSLGIDKETLKGRVDAFGDQVELIVTDPVLWAAYESHAYLTEHGHPRPEPEPDASVEDDAA